MEIFLFFVLVLFVLVLVVGGFSFIWYGITLLKEKDFFLGCFGVYLIILGILFTFSGIGIAVAIFTLGLKF